MKHRGYNVETDRQISPHAADVSSTLMLKLQALLGKSGGVDQKS